MAGLLNGKQLVDGSVTPNKLSERYLQVNEEGEVYGDLIVNGDTTLSETATYKGSEIATKGDLYDEGGIKDLINDLDEKKQDNLIAGENIQIAPDGVTISSSTKVANSDRVLTYDAAGLKANITLVVDGNQIRVEGKTNESGTPYILGEFNVLQSQIIDDVYVENGHLFITFIVDGNPGKEKVDIDLSEFIDIYEGSDYIDINGQEVSLKYSEVRDKLINDGMASTTDLPDLSPYVQKSTTVWGKPLTSNITGDISSTGNITPATTNTYNIGTTAVRYKDIYANSAGFTGTVTATGGFVGNASTATTLQTARNIQLTGVVSGSASFNGSANVTITTTSSTLATKQEVETNTRNIATNKTAIDDLNKRIITTGDGKQFLSDDGTYKGVRDMGSGLVEGSVWRFCDFLYDNFKEHNLKWRIIGDKLEIVGTFVFSSSYTTPSEVSITNIPGQHLERAIETKFIVGKGSTTSAAPVGTASADINAGKLTLTGFGSTSVVDISIPLLDYVFNVTTNSLPALGSNQTVQSIAYGGGRYVVIVRAGSPYKYFFLSSTDGQNWTIKELDEGLFFSAITYAGGKFVAVGASSYANSVDGINWVTGKTDGTIASDDITYGNGLYVAVNSTGFCYSPDGINWTKGNSYSFGARPGIAYGNGLFVITGGSAGYENSIYYSSDGINWTSKTADWYSNSNDIHFIDGSFFTFTSTGYMASSTNAINWKVKKTNVSDEFFGSTYGEGIFMAVYRDGDAYSEGGINWQKRPFSSGGYYTAYLTYGNGKFIIMNPTGNYSVLTR